MKQDWLVPVIAAVVFFAFIFGVNALMNRDSFFIDDYFEVTYNDKNKCTITWDEAKVAKLEQKLTKKLRSNPDYYRQEAASSSKSAKAYLETVEKGLTDGLNLMDVVTVKATYKKDAEEGDYIEVALNTSKSNFLGYVMGQSVVVRNSKIPLRWAKKAN